jgi:hypothetical protein
MLDFWDAGTSRTPFKGQLARLVDGVSSFPQQPILLPGAVEHQVFASTSRPCDASRCALSFDSTATQYAGASAPGLTGKR